MIRFTIIGLILWMVLSSCKRDVLAHAEWDLPGQHWIKGDNKIMTIQAPDTTQAYVMDIRINYNSAYPFQNLYVRLLTTFPSGKEVKSVTSLELANPDGSWAGDCSGSTCSVTLPLHRVFTFPEIGEYKLTIEPYMRLDTIEGIKRIMVTCHKRAK